ncbi:hypothetical protein [Vibrio aestuarianus]|uniref:Uncharacterized protein n=1 Tax=Vibrio aestuarianus TaxID=28171 RepID=A0A9X4F979_9VIBR|nr:hypothetical protein [Vibrio aestuarianus]MDE1347373.1 hypothetical protein [Vibrio aestuarianus]
MELTLVYFKNIIGDEVIRNSSEDLEHQGVSLSIYDRAGKIEASLTDAVSQIFVIFSPALVNSIAAGLMTNAAYEAIKNQLLTFSSDIRGKSYKRFSAQNDIKDVDADFGIKFRAGRDSFDLKISPDASDEVKLKCVEEAFSIIREQGPEKELVFDESMSPKHQIGTFDERSKTYHLIEQSDLIDYLKKQGKL